MYSLRPQQQRSIDNLYHWWIEHRGGIPLIVQPTGGGKSVIIAELCRLLFDTWPEEHPRTLVIVPSKELAEQNGEKLEALLPANLTLGYYSAALGKKQTEADVIVATIGSIYKSAHLLGNIRCVVIDEAHMVNPNGSDTGRYRQFLTNLSQYCKFRVVGCTATPFRGNGIWLTEGDDPLFTGIADTCTISELLDAGFLSPLVRPVDQIKTRIDTSDVSTTGGDYNITQLSKKTQEYLPVIADETVALAKNRKKWLAFTPTIVDAESFAIELKGRAIKTEIVCGNTPKKERAQFVQQFRNGEIQCLITVLALATGFDVPDIDCIVWLRSTISPVLYVQGGGRGLRIAQNKEDCLWLDFTDTTERLGPIDTIKGRAKRNLPPCDAPCILCDGCGARIVPASTIICPECGYVMREMEERKARQVSEAAILSRQAKQKISEYEITDTRYLAHQKPGKPDSLRIDYFAGMRRVASEWICPFHDGFAGNKGRRWCASNLPYMPDTIDSLVYLANQTVGRPSHITVDETKAFPEILLKRYKEIAA